MSAFQRLSDIYHQNNTNPKSGYNISKPTIAYISVDMPVELIIAAGYLPLRLRGNPMATIQFANQYLRSNFNPYLRSVFDRILDLTYSFTERLILSNLDESIVRLFYYLREIQRLEPNPKLPPIEYFEWLHLKTDSSFEYNLQRIENFKQKLENWSSKTISDNDLRNAISICNENRRLLSELADLRRQGLVSGVDALQLIGTSMLMPKHEHNLLLRTFFDEQEFVHINDVFRIYVLGSSVDHQQLYEIIESEGAIVIAEDSDWGSRCCEGQIPETENPIEAITQFYFNRPPYTTKATIDERADYCLSQAKLASADGVIFFIYQGDQPALWDYPEQRNALEANGIPSLLLQTQPYNLTDSGDLRFQIRDFIQSLKREAN